MQNIDDNSLLRLAATGDKLAENALILRYQNYVEVLSRPYFLVGAEQSDIVQIGMIGLLRAIRNYNENDTNTFKTYATKCIRNSILDGVRESNTKKNLLLNSSLSFESEEGNDDAFGMIESMPSSDPNPEEMYLAKEAEEAFFDALSHTLGECDLNVIKLYLSSMPYKEISKKLGITAKKVDNTIYSTKKKIEKLLSDYKK